MQSVDSHEQKASRGKLNVFRKDDQSHQSPTSILRMQKIEVESPFQKYLGETSPSINDDVTRAMRANLMQLKSGQGYEEQESCETFRTSKSNERRKRADRSKVVKGVPVNAALRKDRKVTCESSGSPAKPRKSVGSSVSPSKPRTPIYMKKGSPQKENIVLDDQEYYINTNPTTSPQRSNCSSPQKLGASFKNSADTRLSPEKSAKPLVSAKPVFY